MPTTIDISGSSLDTHAGVSTVVVYDPPANDDIANATSIIFGAVDLDVAPTTSSFSTIASTRESGENVLGGSDASGGMTKGTIWYQVIITDPPIGSIVTFSSSDPVSMEVFAFPAGTPATSSDFPDLEPRGGSVDPGIVINPDDSSVLPYHGITVNPVVGGPSLSWPIRVGEQYYVRVHSLGYYSEPLDGDVTYGITTPILPMTIGVKILYSTPSMLPISILNGTPNAELSFDIDGVVIGDGYTGMLDSDGDLFGRSVPIPFLASGDHLLTVTDLISGYDTGTQGAFTVSDQFAYFDDPTPPTFTLPVVPSPGPDGVLRYFLTDPTDSSTYSFPINPASSSTTAGQRVVTPGSTTSPNGTPLLWEGGKRGRTVTLNGTVLTLSDLEDLRDWCKKPYRIFMSDEIGRQWVVMFRSIKATPVRDVGHPENHSYILTLLLLGRVADLDIPDSGYPGPHVYPSESLYPVDL